MTAINHSLTGALIGLTVADPFIAMPVAFASHFVLDSIPHFGFKNANLSVVTSRRFKTVLITDISLCLCLAVLLAAAKPTHWPIAVICAFLAASPDLGHLNLFYRVHKRQPWQPSLFTKFAAKIQWFERPIGGFVEAIWLGALVICLSVVIPR